MEDHDDNEERKVWPNEDEADAPLVDVSTRTVERRIDSTAGLVSVSTGQLSREASTSA